MSDDDEFDNIPDEFSQIEGVDWDQLLSAPPPSTLDPSPGRLARSPGLDSSTHYSSDDYDLNPAFFAELDDIEKEIIQPQIGISRTNAMHSGGERASGSSSIVNNSTYVPSKVHVSTFVLTLSSSLAFCASPGISFNSPSGNARPPQPCKRDHHESKAVARSPSRKRARESSPLKAPSKKGKTKAIDNERVLHILASLEDELTCPICSDIFVTAHLCSPCGHSVCGECGWQWKNKGKTQCAVCRTELSRDTPLIPNFAIDNTVEKHIAALGQSGVEEWSSGGAKLAEWVSRKEQWKKGAGQRAKVKMSEKLQNQAIVVWEIVNEDELDEIDYDDYDSGTRLVRTRPRRVR